MKKSLCLTLVLILALSLLAGCGKSAAPGGLSEALGPAQNTPEQDPPAAEPEMPASSEEADPEPEGEPAQATGPEQESEPAQEPEREPEPQPGSEAAQPERALTVQELQALRDSLDAADLGFFVTTFDRPEEIDWHQVCYTGAGLSVTLTDEQRQELEGQFGEIMTQAEAIPGSALEQFVRQRTGTEYAAARRPLSHNINWTYLQNGDLWVFLHGDTNAVPIAFTSGTVQGDTYRLVYTRDDPETYSNEREFVMTAVIQDGAWRFVSNLPADAPAPRTLLDITFYETKDEARRAFDVTSFVNIEPQDYEEPYGWRWAVLTARADDVHYRVDRITSVFEYGDGSPTVPVSQLSSGVLRSGQSIAVYVNNPWYPTVRVSAHQGRFWGAYEFGQDNSLHFDDSVPRYVTGHDLQGEGRGCEPASTQELMRFLTDGDWVCFDAQTNEIRGTLRFLSPWQAEIVTRDQAYLMRVADYGSARPGDTSSPFALELEKGDRDDWDAMPRDYQTDTLGKYMVYAMQYDGEQLLFVSPTDDSELKALQYLLPGAAYGDCELEFHRYKGSDDFGDVTDWGMGYVRQAQ